MYNLFIFVILSTKLQVFSHSNGKHLRTSLGFTPPFLPWTPQGEHCYTSTEAWSPLNLLLYFSIELHENDSSKIIKVNLPIPL